MSKPKHPRLLAETEAQAVTWNIRVSPRKLNLVAGMIRGKKAQDAVAQLTFSKRRIAVTVKKTLESAIANAENNHSLDVDRLVVSKAEVGSIISRRTKRAIVSLSCACVAKAVTRPMMPSSSSTAISGASPSNGGMAAAAPNTCCFIVATTASAQARRRPSLPPK